MFSPFMTIITLPLPINVAMAVILFGVAYAILTLKLQRTLSHPKKMRDIQMKISALTKELGEMSKRNEDITEKQKEIMPLMKQSMQMQMKSMVVIFPLFLFVYYLALPTIFGAFSAEAFNFIVPLPYNSLFIVTAIVTGLIMSFTLLAKDRVSTKQKAQVQMPEPEMNS